MILSFIIRRLRAFKHAFAGLWYLIRTQENAWLHTAATVLVLLMSIWLQLAARDWALIVIAISMVWIAEFLNTALEAVVDLASPQKHPLAKAGKDVGAAAVLISALTSIIIGLLTLGPPLLNKFK